ncbi:MAG: YbaB/EbfC family nucleoid-associated protein [Planctomycetales bacterium]|nr:YbaB/EbfC family nucleoid-associated protein [Planctomycetales bacterium]
MFKNLANLASMMKQATQISGRMEEVQNELREKRVSGVAGGGLVEVECNGVGEMLRLQIDPTLIAKGEQDVIEDLVRAAANEAHAKSRQLHLEAMKSLTGGLSIPGLDDALSQLGGGGA